MLKIDEANRTVTLVTTLGHGSGKRMETWFEVDMNEPFEFTTNIHVVPDSDEDEFDDFWNAIYNVQLQKVSIVCDIDEHGSLTSSPSKITILETKD
ncbi:hypothetical protein [Erythrobacter aureus]|uniref:Uncharacterized protein n=1 Tax=Erythrobacter aureus TaxID=2182384 RepID=A0A345YIP1_9SPHN|nr:hypothetical protein [Erythrobacter aureus]AXK43793.1 hypothetical protein DVR09_15160 [Erythrobacter aureus]